MTQELDKTFSAPQHELIIVTQSFGNDGAQHILSKLAGEWARQGVHVIAVRTNKFADKTHYQLSPDIEMIDFPSSIGFRPFRVLQDNNRLKALFRAHPNAVGLAFLSGSIMKLGFLSLFVDNKIVVSERNDPRRNPAKSWLRHARDWALSRADLCVFQTTFVRDLFPDHIRRKSVVITNPVDGNLPEPYVGERRKAVVTACRLEPQKNVPLLLRAFARFHEEHPDYTLEIYGEGKERAQIEALVDTLGLSECVMLPGHVPDVHTKMNDAAMFVLSSDYEGISNSMLEALALGVPTVVTDCPIGGAAETIQDGVNGLLVPVGDETALSQAMCRIVEEEGLAERLSRESVTIRDRLPLEKIALQWTEAIWPETEQSHE